MRPTTYNSLTVTTLWKSKMMRYSTGHQSIKRKYTLAYLVPCIGKSVCPIMATTRYREIKLLICIELPSPQRHLHPCILRKICQLYTILLHYRVEPNEFSILEHKNFETLQNLHISPPFQITAAYTNEIKSTRP